MDRRIDVMWPEGNITELHKHSKWVWQSVWIVSSRHGPRFRFPQAMKQKEVERRSISRATEAGGIMKEAGPMRKEARGRKQGQGVKGAGPKEPGPGTRHSRVQWTLWGEKAQRLWRRRSRVCDVRCLLQGRHDGFFPSSYRLAWIQSVIYIVHSAWASLFRSIKRAGWGRNVSLRVTSPFIRLEVD